MQRVLQVYQRQLTLSRLLQLGTKCRALLQLLAPIWPAIAVVVMSLFQMSEPNRGFLLKTKPIPQIFWGEPNQKSKINSADPLKSSVDSSLT